MKNTRLSLLCAGGIACIAGIRCTRGFRAAFQLPGVEARDGRQDRGILPQDQSQRPGCGALTSLMERNRRDGTFAVLERGNYVPETAPGELVAVIERPGDGPELRIFDLSP